MIKAILYKHYPLQKMINTYIQLDSNRMLVFINNNKYFIYYSNITYYKKLNDMIILSIKTKKRYFCITFKFDTKSISYIVYD